MAEYFQEISTKGLLTLDYYEGLFNMLLFWYYFTTFAVTLFSLLYYRKFVDK